MGTGTTEVERLFAEHERELGRFLAQIVGSRALAEDLVQETFVVALREDLGSVDNVRAWLYAVARNRALHALRTRRRARSAFWRLHGSRHEQVDDPADAAAIRDVLERCLDEDDRIILVLRHLHGFDSSELGAILDVSPAAARQRLSRARRRLLVALDGHADLDATSQPGAAGLATTEVRLLQEYLAPLAEVAPAARRR